MADKNSISSFLSSFYGGTRLNRFKVTTSNCGASDQKLVDADVEFHIRAAATPESNITPIGINYFGRTIPIPGERTYTPWVITVLDDRGTRNLYDKIKKWHTSIISADTTTVIDTSSIKTCQFSIEHYSNNNEANKKKFTLYQAWPIEVGAFNLDMSQDNVLATFQVTIAYTHFDFSHT